MIRMLPRAPAPRAFVAALPVRPPAGSAPRITPDRLAAPMDISGTLRTLFTVPQDPSLLQLGTYDPWLVTLSLAIAIFTSWMAFQVSGLAFAHRRGRLRNIALLTGSIALGCGVWAMHFIGMLAFSLCNVTYDPALTAWSLVPSVFASAIALHVIGRERVSTRRLVVGGVLVGAGIGCMHYVGMAAMTMPLAQRYDPALFALSIVVAVALAFLSLWIRFGLGQVRKLSAFWRLNASAVVMGCAIAAMHYTGMAAARFVGNMPVGSTSGGGNASTLAIAISLTTVALATIVLATNAYLRVRELYRRLSERQARMRSLLATTVDGVLIFDASGRIGEVNTTAEELFGWQHGEAIGTDITHLMTESHAREFRQALDSLSRPGAIAGLRGSREIVVRKRDGTEIPVRLAVGHTKLDHEDLFIAFVSDISERLRMERALRESEEQLRSLIGNIPGVTYRCLVTRDGHEMVFVSEGVERLTGFPASDFLGPDARVGYLDLVHPDDRDAVTTEIGTALREERPYRIEYRLVRRDGSTCWMWGSGRIVHTDQRSGRWLDGVIIDITDRHHMEEALRESRDRAELAAESRAAFLANMSHEIRTPMNAILGFTDVLLQSSLDDTQRRRLETVQGSARSLLRLLNDVLDAARLDKGAIELCFGDFDLAALVADVRATFGPDADRKGIALVHAWDDTLPRLVHGDELRVRQILVNLVSNGIKFTEHGTVSIDVGREGQEIHIRIRDTGIGVAPDRLEAIFEPFTQADASTTRRYGGTGLGTTICRQLVDLMGGSIRAESTPGSGSTFHVVLPLRAAAGIRDDTRREPDAARLPPLRILCVDDVPENLELLEIMLSARGHTVLTAADGQAAVEIASREHPDLVLLDLHMPGMGGCEACTLIRARERGRDQAPVPVIALSASVLAPDRDAAMAAGMNGFATKPVDLPVLEREIARVLGLAATSAAPAVVEDTVEYVDVTAGVRRWAGKRAKYLDALGRFLRSHAETPANLADAIARDDLAAARALAHRLRGVSANLALDRLARLMARVEEACDAGDGAMLATLKTGLATEFDETVRHVTLLDAPDIATPAVGDALRG
ncbi:MAG: PAS domain S-box protein [Betaproteobacteria bacterium]|nr:PAS domain S-box protein [Betaproteobacteria bacterium]